MRSNSRSSPRRNVGESQSASRTNTLYRAALLSPIVIDRDADDTCGRFVGDLSDSPWGVRGANRAQIVFQRAFFKRSSGPSRHRRSCSTRGLADNYSELREEFLPTRLKRWRCRRLPRLAGGGIVSSFEALLNQRGPDRALPPSTDGTVNTRCRFLTGTAIRASRREQTIGSSVRMLTQDEHIDGPSNRTNTQRNFR